MAIYYDKQSKLELFEKVIATLRSKLAIYYAKTKKKTSPLGWSCESINYDANCYPEKQ